MLGNRVWATFTLPLHYNIVVTLLLKKYFNTYLLVQIFVKQQRLLEYFNCCVLLLAVAATFVPVEGKQVRFVLCFVYILFCVLFS